MFVYTATDVFWIGMFAVAFAGMFVAAIYYALRRGWEMLRDAVRGRFGRGP